MADSLKLIGVNHIRRHKGKELQYVPPNGESDQHIVKRWWRDSKDKGVFIACTKFKVKRKGGDVVILVPAHQETQLDIAFDGNRTWNFRPASKDVPRVGIFTADNRFIEEYVFPTVSGGRIMRVTNMDAAGYPEM